MSEWQPERRVNCFHCICLYFGSQLLFMLTMRSRRTTAHASHCFYSLCRNRIFGDCAAKKLSALQPSSSAASLAATYDCSALYNMNTKQALLFLSVHYANPRHQRSLSPTQLSNNFANSLNLCILHGVSERWLGAPVLPTKNTPSIAYHS